MTTGARSLRSVTLAAGLALTGAQALLGAEALAQPAPAQPAPAAPTPPRPGPPAPAPGPAPRPAAPGSPAAPAPPPPAEATAPPAPPSLSESLTGMAKAEYEAGRILYQDGDFASALVKFEQALSLSKDERLLWNIAVCEKNLRRYSKVLTTLAAYLKLGPEILTEKDRSDAAELEEAVKAFVSRVTLRVNEEGADVFLDELRIGTSPLPGPVMVDVGERRFRVSKPGFVPFEKTQSIAGANDVDIPVTLVAEVHEGTLVIEAGPNDTIFLDGKRMGTRRWQGVLPSGPHTLRVTANGMIAYQSEVVIADGQTRNIPVTLQPLAAGGVNKWFFIVGGGVLLAAGAITAGVLLAQPGDPATTPGTIQPGTIQLNLGGGR